MPQADKQRILDGFFALTQVGLDRHAVEGAVGVIARDIEMIPKVHQLLLKLDRLRDAQ